MIILAAMPDAAAGEAVSRLGTPDYIILAGYFVLVLGVGLFFARHIRGMKDYFKGGNTIPWWLSGVSFYMTSFSVAAFVFYPSICYEHGLVGVTLLWVAVPAALFSSLLFSKRWRRARIDSPVEYIETRYSPVLRQVFAWQGVPVALIDDALKIVATGAFISVALGIEKEAGIHWSIVGTGLIMLTYTFLGGLWAVTVTDFLQFVVLSAAVLVVVPLSVRQAGGIATLVRESPAGFFRPTGGDYGWLYVISLVLLYSLAWSTIKWPLIQRYYCVPKERDARKVGWLVAGLYIVGPPLMFLPAIAAARFLPGVANSRDIFPEVCRQLLPAGMMGLVTAGMFAATMSTLSSDYNVCASVLTNDVYRRLVRPQASQKELVWVGRGMTFVSGLFAMGLALLFARGTGKDLFETMVTLFSIATAPVAIPMLLGLISRRFSNESAIAGFAAGLVAGVALFLFCPDAVKVAGQTVEKESILFLGSAAVTLAAMGITARILPPREAARERIDAFHRRLETPIGDLEEDRADEAAAAVVSPFRVVGISMALIGVLMIGVLPWVWGEALAFGIDAALGIAFIGAGLLVARIARR
ncbi:MAG: sodium transporter [Planctomycetes bacterium]|nr:sodium transporter [Planctomycetota bacterium]